MLTDTAVKKAKAKAKAFKLYDTGGMFLLVTPTGARLWRLKFRFACKEKLLALGQYPEVTLADARAKRDEARKLLREGVDPAIQRKLDKVAKVDAAVNTLEALGREWFAKFSAGWAPSHTRAVMLRLKNHVFPWLGTRAISEITPPEILAILRRIESRGTLETAHRVRTHLGMIFRFAISTGRAGRDPTADLRGALPAAKPKHMAAVTDPKQLGGLLRAISTYNEGTPTVAAALKLLPMLFVRPGELRSALWA